MPTPEAEQIRQAAAAIVETADRLEFRARRRLWTSTGLIMLMLLMLLVGLIRVVMQQHQIRDQLLDQLRQR